MENQSPYLKLPLEIRNQIYEEVLLPNNSVILDFINPPFCFCRDRASILRVNRQIHDEAAHIEYSAREYTIMLGTSSTYRPREVESLLRSLTDISVVAKDRIDKLTVHYNDHGVLPSTALKRLPFDRILQLIDRCGTIEKLEIQFTLWSDVYSCNVNDLMALPGMALLTKLKARKLRVDCWITDRPRMTYGVCYSRTRMTEKFMKSFIEESGHIGNGEWYSSTSNSGYLRFQD